MRTLSLLRAARAAAAALEPFGSLAPEACCSAWAPLRAGSQLTSLVAYQHHQAARYAAARRPGDSDEEDGALEGGRHSKLSHSQRRQLIARKMDEGLEQESEDRIGSLLRGLGRGSDDSASQFVSSFFGERRKAAAAAAAGFGTDGEDEEASAERLAAVGAEELDLEEEEAGLEEELLDAEGAQYAAGLEEGDEEALQVSLPESLQQDQEELLMKQLQGLRPGSRRKVLERLLDGGIMRDDPTAQEEWEEIKKQYQPPADFRMKVVDVNRTCKGTRTGGLYRYSCMVVVGNGNGVLGWGQGKAAEVNDAVQKAYQRACRNLYPIPRYNDHTIPEPTNAKFGQVRITMYPKASGNGIVANPLMYEICKMAGIHDIGVKVHGSRNVRNAVKCLFKAFDQMRTEEDMAEAAGLAGKVIVKMPPGRYSQLRI